MAATKKPMPKEKGVSIINKNLPSFGSDKQLEASIGKQVRMARKNAGVVLYRRCHLFDFNPRDVGWMGEP